MDIHCMLLLSPIATHTKRERLPKEPPAIRDHAKGDVFGGGGAPVSRRMEMEVKTHTKTGGGVFKGDGIKCCFLNLEREIGAPRCYFEVEEDISLR